MNKTLAGILFWVLFLGALGYGAYRYYTHDRDLEEKTPIPIRVRESQLKQSAPPLEKFQEDMGKRLQRSEERGVDLSKSKESR